jgi:type IV pilus assembly protein PilN
MIKVNLLHPARRGVKKKAVAFAAGQKTAAACAVILIGAAGTIGWRDRNLTRESGRLDREIAAAQQETARLHSVIVQVQQFEQRRAQLQQRVALIEQLRKDQTGPVHMLDQISRALPPTVWLTELKQTQTAEVMIEGRSSALTGLSDFVGNLESSGYFKRSVEIVSSTTETGSPQQGDLITFQIRAVFQRAPALQPAEAVGPVGRAPQAQGGSF